MGSIKDYLNFNKRQERGIFVLSLILLISILSTYLSPFIFKSTPEINEQNQLLSQVKLQSIAHDSKRIPNSLEYTTSRSISKDIEINPINEFDPNLISSEELLAMGLPKKVASNLVKYTSKGGRFYKDEDLKKVYGMTDQIFISLKPFIKIGRIKVKSVIVNSKEDSYVEQVAFSYSKPKETYKGKKKVDKLGINSADSLQLLDLVGIGPYYAGEIIKYKKKLGGYNDILQLKELYKMDDEKYVKFSSQLVLDSIILNRININTADFKAILRHPYIDYETTKYIVNKRSRLGKYAALYQLKDSLNMPDHLYEKLSPYLVID